MSDTSDRQEGSIETLQYMVHRLQDELNEVKGELDEVKGYLSASSALLASAIAELHVLQEAELERVRPVVEAALAVRAEMLAGRIGFSSHWNLNREAEFFSAFVNAVDALRTTPSKQELHPTSEPVSAEGVKHAEALFRLMDTKKGNT